MYCSCSRHLLRGLRCPCWEELRPSLRGNTHDLAPRTRFAGPDHGDDNFSYDPDHLIKWEMPNSTVERELPDALRRALEDWVSAGAAMSTAIDRAVELYASASRRAWPLSSHPHLVKERLDSVDMSTGKLGSSSVEGSPTYGNSTQSSLANLKVAANSPPRAMRMPIGMESPPFTPLDTHACPSPFNNDDESSSGRCNQYCQGPSVDPTAMSLDQDIPTTTPNPGSPSFSPPLSNRSSVALSPLPKINERAWETFISACKAERDEALHVALPRLRGYGRLIDRKLLEWAMDKHVFDSWTPKQRHAVADFIHWWRGDAKTLLKGIEAKVKDVEPLPEFKGIVGFGF